MCSRFSQPYRISLKAKWDKINNPRKLPVFDDPRFNVAPTDEALVITYEHDEMQFDRMVFGLIPRWAKDVKMGLNCINARSETITEKPSFRIPFQRQRCLIPVDGFFEWQREGKVKLPYRFVMSNDEPFSLAGLWDAWTAPGGQVLHSFAVITTEPNALLATIHDRMPVILDASEETRWLTTPAERAGELLTLLKPFPAERMKSYRVSSKMNSSRYKDKEAIEPIAGESAERLDI